MASTAVNRLMAAFISDAQTLMDGYTFLGPVEWEREFKRLIVERHAATYFAGQGLNALSAVGDRELGALFQQQFDYLAGFAADLEAGKLSEAQAKARAALYAGALKSTFTRGQYALWRIPVHPGDGQSECKVNCRCVLRVRVINLEELDADVIWDRSASESCPTCVRRARQSPYPTRGGVFQKALR